MMTHAMKAKFNLWINKISFDKERNVSVLLGPFIFFIKRIKWLKPLDKKKTILINIEAKIEIFHFKDFLNFKFE